MEVGVAHKAGASVLREVTADTARVSGGPSIQHHTKLVVINVVSVSPNFSQVVLHVDCQLEFVLDNINERVFRYRSFLGREPPEGNESIHFINKVKPAYSTRQTRFLAHASALILSNELELG